MGLLDWQDDADDFFPNYDYKVPSQPTAHITQINSSVGSLTSEQSRTSSDSSDSAEAGQRQRTTSDAATSVTTSNTSTSTVDSAMIKKTRPLRRNSRMQHKAEAPKRKMSSNFDLFGTDEELQAAEARISFCEICLKHCDVH